MIYIYHISYRYISDNIYSSSAHEKCVKANYAAIVATLDDIYTQIHEPGTLGLKGVHFVSDNPS